MPPIKTTVIKVPQGGELGEDDLKKVAAAVKSCKIIAFPSDTPASS